MEGQVSFHSCISSSSSPPLDNNEQLASNPADNVNQPPGESGPSLQDNFCQPIINMFRQYYTPVNEDLENIDLFIENFHAFEPIDSEQEELFASELFLLCQFNVHYLSWIKNREFQVDFMDRFSFLFERVFKLCRQNSAWSRYVTDHNSCERFKNWIIYRSIQLSLSYRRVLKLQLTNVTSAEFFKTKKILQVQLDTGSEESYQSDIVSDTKSKTRSLLYRTNKESSSTASLLDSFHKLSNMMNEDLMNNDNGGQMDDNWSEMSEDDMFEYLHNLSYDKFQQYLKMHYQEMKKLESENCKQDIGDCDKSHNANQGDHRSKVFAQIEVVNEATCCLVLPTYLNLYSKEAYIKLLLYDLSDSDEEELKKGPINLNDKQCITINISEGNISGFTGFYKDFRYKMPQSEDIVSFGINLKWMVDSSCYCELLSERCSWHILNNLSGSILYISSYYWFFYRAFFQTMATHPNAGLRFVAMKSFRELCLTFNPSQLGKDLAPLFMSMYSLPYPTEAEVASMGKYVDGAYEDEPSSMLNNLIFVFAHLSPHDQMSCLKRLQPNITQLMSTCKVMVSRLLFLTRENIGNYDSDEIEQVILPICLTILADLCTVEKSEQWPIIQNISDTVIQLLEESIQCFKPPNWMNFAITNPYMIRIHRLLESLIENLLTPEGYKFLNTIYYRIRYRNILHLKHVEPFLTKERVAQYFSLISPNMQAINVDCK